MAASIGAVTSSAASALQWGRRHGPRRRGDTPPRAPRTARASEAPPPSFEETEAILRRASEAPPPSFEETEAILRRASEARTEGGPPPGFERTMLWSDDQKKFVNAGEPQTRLDDPCLQGLTIEPGEVISRINKARGKGGRLDLTGIGLTKVPDEVWTLTDLTDLQLSNNKITRIPDDVGNLTELERLGLAGNRLTEIPEGIGGCECLEGLWAHGNLIGRVPDAVGRCERLRHLMLAGNRIRELPASLGDCKYLEELSVPGNRLESLPETIGGAYMLRVIDVHGNRIARLPDSIARLKSLEELSAQGNLLTSIPDDVGEMRRLVRLNVAENELSSLPKGLGDAAMMTTLWCYGNPALRSLPMSLAKNVSLKSVWCEGCDALEGDGVRELVEALPTRKGGVAATIGLDLAQCTRAGLKIRPATELDVNAAGGLACEHPHVTVSEIPGGGGGVGGGDGNNPGADAPNAPGRYSRGYFKHVRWTEDADAPVLIVAFGSAPGVPNWGGLLRKLRKDVLARGVACAGGAGADAAAAVEAAAVGFDVLYVADVTRSWYHGGGIGGGTASNDEAERSWREGIEGIAGRYARVLNLGDSMGASAALLFADVADHAVAFCPQVDLVSASIRPGRSARWMRYFRKRLVAAVDRAVTGPRRSRVEIHSGTWEHDLAQADFVPDAVGRDRIDAEGLALNVVLHQVDNHRLALALEEGDELLPMVRKAYHTQLAAARAGDGGGGDATRAPLSGANEAKGADAISLKSFKPGVRLPN